jgi:hypothetical protein
VKNRIKRPHLIKSQSSRHILKVGIRADIGIRHNIVVIRPTVHILSCSTILRFGSLPISAADRSPLYARD